MTTHSGMEGFCLVCGHANNHHRTAPCPAAGCSNRWKACTIGGCFRIPSKDSKGAKGAKGSKGSKGSKVPASTPYRFCFGCKDHPACREDVDIYKNNQIDVLEQQNEDYTETGTAGGQDAEGNWDR